MLMIEFSACNKAPCYSMSRETDDPFHSPRVVLHHRTQATSCHDVPGVSAHQNGPYLISGSEAT